MQHDYICTKWILDPSGPHPLVPPPGVTSKFQMYSSSPHPWGYRLWKFWDSKWSRSNGVTLQMDGHMKSAGIMSCAMWKRVFRHVDSQSSFQTVQSEQGLLCPLTESLDTTECFNGEQRIAWNFVHMQHDAIPHFRKHFFCLTQPK